MTSIHTQNQGVTLINTFEVLPENQEKLVKLLDEATENVMKNMDGFLSANIHKSIDGKKVANYAQWRSMEDFKAMQHDPDAQEHMFRAQQLCESFDPVMYHVESIHEGKNLPNRQPDFLDRR